MAVTYINPSKIEDSVIGPTKDNPIVLKDIAEGASRVIDHFCEVEEGFFGPAEDAQPADKTFYGNGTDMLRIPPVRSVVSVTVDGTELDAANYRLTGSTAQFLLRTDGATFLDDNKQIIVNANWGFASVPKDIQELTRELTVYSWKLGDPSFLQQLQIEQTALSKGLSPNSWARLKSIRDRVSARMGFA